MSANIHPRYRADIDGLRMVAVTSVVLFHALPHAFPGGFVGVDVFFVISGYLITTIITRSVEERRFSLLEFYERRARRILPALFVVIAASLGAGWLMLFPNDFAALGQSATAAATFWSNWYFAAATADYFAEASEFMPLLHTWSLAVEEQFYIGAPILLFFAGRYGGRKGAIGAVAIVFAVSLWWSIAHTAAAPARAFFLPFTRTHELALGGLLALLPLPVLPRIGREAAAVIGLGLLGYAIWGFSAATIFPGAAALIPCVGTGLLIATGRDGTLVGRTLSWRPIVFVGLVSYSWYLWHWPVLAFARVRSATIELPVGYALTLVLVSLLLAILSWRFVERPFRGPGKGLPNRPAVFAASAASIMAVALAGTGIARLDGVPSRIPEIATAALQQQEHWNNSDRLTCVNGEVAFSLTCRAKGAGDGPADVALIGDSHAGALAPGLLTALAERGLVGEVYVFNGCLPVLGISRVTETGMPIALCRKQNEWLAEQFRTRDDAPLVVMHGRWALHGRGTSVDLTNAERSIRYERERGQPISEFRGNLPLVTDGAGAMVDAIVATGRRVAILGSVPEPGWNVPEATARHLGTGAPYPKGPTIDLYAPEERGAFDAWLRQLATGKDGVTYSSIIERRCDHERCIVADPLPFYSDENHASVAGADEIAAWFVPELLNEGAAPGG